jgi:hypothetical protein
MKLHRGTHRGEERMAVYLVLVYPRRAASDLVSTLKSPLVHASFLGAVNWAQQGRMAFAVLDSTAYVPHLCSSGLNTVRDRGSGQTPC